MDIYTKEDMDRDIAIEEKRLEVNRIALGELEEQCKRLALCITCCQYLNEDGLRMPLEGIDSFHSQIFESYSALKNRESW
jgi:hypothetical protein